MGIKIIVVVEDKESEQEKALEAIKFALGNEVDEFRVTIIPGSPQVGLKQAKTLVLFAANLKVAQDRINFLSALKEAAVGVITDLMFPASKGAKEEPNGLGVIVSCIHSGIPVVVCSDTDHHDVGYLKTVFPVLGSAHPKGEIPVILDSKDWSAAVVSLMKLMAEPDELLHADPV